MVTRTWRHTWWRKSQKNKKVPSLRQGKGWKSRYFGDVWTRNVELNVIGSAPKPSSIHSATCDTNYQCERQTELWGTCTAPVTDINDHIPVGLPPWQTLWKGRNTLHGKLNLLTDPHQQLPSSRLQRHQSHSNPEALMTTYIFTLSVSPASLRPWNITINLHLHVENWNRRHIFIIKPQVLSFVCCDSGNYCLNLMILSALLKCCCL